MNGVMSIANDWAATWCDALLRASWIGGLVILIAWTITSLFPQIPIFARSWLWRLVYLKLLVVLCWTAPIELPLLPPMVPSNATVPRGNLPETRPAQASVADIQSKTVIPNGNMAPPAKSPEVASLSASFWLFACWVVGVLACAGTVVRNWITMNKLRAACAPAEDAPLTRLCAELCEQIGCRVPPRLLTTDAAVSPQLVGIVHPCIIVPQALVHTDPANARMILAHELAHWKRRDLMWNWLPTTVGSLFYFHPGVWLAQREWRLAQELACDEAAIQVAKARPDAYGRMLLEVARMCRSNWRPSLLSIGVGQSFRGLSRRIFAMKAYESPSRVRIISAVALLAAVAILGLVPWKLTAREIATASASDDSKTTTTETTVALSAAAPKNLGGRIYVVVSLRTSDTSDIPVTYGNIVVAIDPNTGRWERLRDSAKSLRVSRDGAATALDIGNKVFIGDFKNRARPRELDNLIMGHSVWSPDGKEIVVSHQKTNEEFGKSKPKKPVWNTETWKYSVDGSQKTLLPIPDTDSVMDWSPDGKWFLTCSDRNPPFNSFQLYLVSPDGGEHRFLTQGRGTNTSGRFSPDGKQIVYTHQEGQQFSIRMLTLADRKEALVVEQDGPKAVVSACWSPDGKYLAVSRFDYHVLEPHGVLINPPHLDANYRLEIMSLDGKERREIKLEGAEVKSMSLNDWR